MYMWRDAPRLRQDALTAHAQAAAPPHGLESWGRPLNGLAPAATAGVIVGAVLLAHLAARSAAAVLPPLNEAAIPVDTHDAIVKLTAANVADRVLGVGAAVVFYEAEAAWRLRVAIKPHYDAPHLADAAEERIDLLFSCVKREVADIERRRLLDLLLPAALPTIVLAVRIQGLDTQVAVKMCHVEPVSDILE